MRSSGRNFYKTKNHLEHSLTFFKGAAINRRKTQNNTRKYEG